MGERKNYSFVGLYDNYNCSNPEYVNVLSVKLHQKIINRDAEDATISTSISRSHNFMKFCFIIIFYLCCVLLE